MKRPENPPAFPVHPSVEHELGEGMTLRDWFAGQALIGSMAGIAGEPYEFAEEAYAVADAMLAERAKGVGQ